MSITVAENGAGVDTRASSLVIYACLRHKCERETLLENIKGEV